MLGVNAGRITGKKEAAGERRKASTRGNSKKGLKVVYISSPMMVKTSAAEFRSTVQELTGRDSDVARLMDRGDWYHHNQEESEVGLPPIIQDMPQNSNQSFGSSDGSGGDFPNYFLSFETDSPSDSDSLFKDMGLQQHRDVDVFTSTLFQDSTLLDVIGSFDLA